MNTIFSQKPLIALSLIVAPFYFSQNKAEDAITKFAKEFPQEKIHLLFNKKNYVAGETLWFKSFVFEGYSPSTISTNLFVELYDKDKKQIDKKLLPLLNGEGSGSFTLPENLREDVYFIRAYTTWMGNFSEDFNALISIPVYNPSSPDRLIKNMEGDWTASLFPEGGSFIDGIKTKFAVRLNSSGEAPSNWSGYIIDSANPEIKITSFTGLDQNVSSFTFTPKFGIKYQAILSNEKNRAYTVNLPEVLKEGIHIEVFSKEDAVKFKLQASKMYKDAPFKILGTINNQLVYKAKITKVTDQEYSIPTDQLVNGILNLAVFDENENIILQRLCFIQPQKLKLNKPKLAGLSLSYTPRDTNSFNILKNTGADHYTVSIVDENTELSEDEYSLPSTLWITGDLSSRIYNPSQYFKENRNIEALDALMISEKWNRFSWPSIISGKYPRINHYPETYLSYKGKAMKQGKPAENEEINLIFKMPNQSLKYNVITTGKDGLFTLDGLVFEDSMKFSYQLNNADAKKNDVQVYFQPNYNFIPYRKSLPETSYKLVNRSSAEYVDPKITEEITRVISQKTSEKFYNEKITEIEEVKLKVQRKDLTKKLNNELSSPLFKSGNEVIFDFVNENTGAESYSNILQWLQGRVAGLQIQFQGGGYSANYRGEPIGIFLDEMRIDPSQISSISVATIAMVKVIRGYFAGSFGGGNGAIAIYTKRGTTAGSSIDPSLPSKLTETSLKGYDKEAVFNNLIYDNESTKAVPEDKRNVLYWNPYVEASSNENSIIQWYNNDSAKNFRVIIIGFDENHDPVYYNETFK